MMAQVMRHCLQHFMLSMWRRKSLVLALIVGTSVLIVCLQYSSVGGHNDVFPRDVQTSRHELPLGMHGLSHRAMVPRRNLSALAQGGDGHSAARVHHGYMANLAPDEVRYQSVGQQPKDPGGGQPSESNSVNSWQQPQKLPQAKPLNWQHPSWDRQQPLLEQQQQQQQGAAGNKDSTYYIPPLRVVHFDLKGAPPKISYFKQIFPMLREAGANAILLEYEDMFPFTGSIKGISAGNAYSKEDVQTLLGLAKDNNFEVIPLVQTFGHLEFVLKLQEFRHLREVDDFPQALCPARNDTFAFVQTMIDQVMAMHPHIKWLHIGCDEVYHLGYCAKCRYQDRDNLFLNHVARVARYVRDKHNVIPIIWDDMLRQMPAEKLKEFQMDKLVEPMVWSYVKDLYRFIPYTSWMIYSDVFPYIWAASAFKGAFGETLTVPNAKMHLENNEAWLEVMSEQHKKFKSFRGLVITGWQRYDHLATLCEVLPAGLPSLVLNLLTVTQGYYNLQLFNKFYQIMQCTTHPRTPVDLESDPYLWQRASGCFFPGSQVFRLTQHHSEAIKRVNDYVYDVTVHKAWMSDYNVRHNITNPMRIEEGLTEHSSVYYPLASMVRTARDALREVFDEYTVAEWIEQKIYPYILKMEKVMKDGMDMKKAKVWPKRPLPPLEDLKRFSVGTKDEDNNQVWR